MKRERRGKRVEGKLRKNRREEVIPLSYMK